MEKIFSRYTMFVAFVAIGGCTAPATRGLQSPACGGDTMIETQLFFGMNRPDGGAVSEQEWDAFLQREVVPRFAEGFAVVETNGFWQDGRSRQTFTEPGRMISRLLRPGDAEDVLLIVDAYKQAFNQESVLRIDTVVCALF